MKYLTISRESCNEPDLVIKYDDDKYDFKYTEELGKIILERKSDNQVLHIFDVKATSFITQYDLENETHFLISEKIPVSTNYDLYSKQFVDYVVSKHGDTLKVGNLYKCWDIIRIADNSYIILSAGGQYIFSVEYGATRNYRHAFVSEYLNEIVGRDAVFVEDEFTAFHNSDIKDNLIYGLDPVSFKIITPIWSNKQQEFIELKDNYTRSELTGELIAKGYTDIPSYGTRHYSDAVTLFLEVQCYLEQKSAELPHQFTVTDLVSGKNKEFVKKFAPKTK